MNRFRFLQFALCLLAYAVCDAQNSSAGDDLYNSRFPSHFSGEISVAYPEDLVAGNMSAEDIADILTYGRELLAATRSSRPLLAPEEERILDITTTEYGQLSLILDEQHGETATKIIVSGPIDWSDFAAIWDCAIEDNLLELDLKNADIRDKTIPDYALYDPSQLKPTHFLSIRKIILPDDVVRIGKAAFTFMMLEEINIPSSLRELGSTALGYNMWLDCELEIPEGYNPQNEMFLNPKTNSLILKNEMYLARLFHLKLIVGTFF